MPQKEIDKIQYQYEGKFKQLFKELSALKEAITALSDDKVDIENFKEFQNLIYAIMNEKLEENEYFIKSLISKDGKVTKKMYEILKTSLNSISSNISNAQQKLEKMKTTIDENLVKNIVPHEKFVDLEIRVETLESTSVGIDEVNKLIDTKAAEKKSESDMLGSTVDILATNSISIERYKVIDTVIDTLLTASKTQNDTKLKEQNLDLHELCRRFNENRRRLEMFNNQFSQLENLAKLIGEKTQYSVTQQMMEFLNKIKQEYENYSIDLLSLILKKDKELISSIENCASKIAAEMLK